MKYVKCIWNVCNVCVKVYVSVLGLFIVYNIKGSVIVFDLFVWFFPVKNNMLFACIISNLKSTMCNLRISNEQFEKIIEINNVF